MHPTDDRVTPSLDAWRRYAEQRRAGTLTPPSVPKRPANPAR